jgi:hypothetical protein
VKHLEEIREDGQVSVEVLDEDKGPKKYVFRGIVSRADVRNGNNRVYPRSVLAKAIGKLSEKLDGRTFGEADHPTDRPSVMRVAGIHRKVWMEADGTVWGESIIPETAMGRDLIAIANAGGRIGISTRGRGSVRTETWNDGKPADVIEDDYEMATWDFVVNQSEQSAEVVDVLRGKPGVTGLRWKHGVRRDQGEHHEDRGRVPGEASRSLPGGARGVPGLPEG